MQLDLIGSLFATTAVALWWHSDRMQVYGMSALA